MNAPLSLSRRAFLKTAAAGAAVLAVGVNARGVLAAGNVQTVVNPFVVIDRDGVVTVIIKHFEMGQGTTTGLATLVAEEIDADWNKLEIDFAPADGEKYKNLFWGMQGTGGSSAIANSFTQYRQAGATARDLLVRAAAQTWNVDASAITVDKGILSAGSRRGHFGDFIGLAKTLTPAESVMLKTPEQFKLIGNSELPRIDSSGKVDGTAMFAMDVKLPGMVYAAILRSPRFGGTLQSFNADKSKKMPGFIEAKAMPDNSGVAVYANSTWAAFKARDSIEAEWDFSTAESRSTDEMIAAHRALLSAPEYDVKPFKRDQALAAIQQSAQTLEAEFVFPLLAHAPMEALNCVIEPTENGVRFHDGCQTQGMVQSNISQLLGLEQNQVEIKTVYAGGSFGRRGTPNSDYQVEAAMAFDLLGRKTPVKLVWSREDDIRGGQYRAMALHKVQVGLDQQGKVQGWDHRIATKSIMKGTPFEAYGVKEGVDQTSVEGVADSLYQLPGMAVGLSDFTSAMPTLWWRSVGHTHTAYAMESLMDMVAHANGQDPVALRLSLLDRSNDQQRRMAGVIEAARDMAGWQPGDKRGFAAHHSFKSWVAVVADVNVDGNEVHVNKLHMAIDCGVPVNPDVIVAQLEGGAGYALSAILREEITLDKGEVIQSNFPDYTPLRITDMPEIEVKIITSAEPPTGVGEPGVPPTGPAVANAIFALTGTRITELPMTKAGFVFV